MEITIDDASGLPEALRSLVSDVDGKAVLDLAKVAPATELERFKGKALTAEQEAIDRRKALSAWKALGESPDAVQAAISAKGKPDADQQAIIDQMRSEFSQKEQSWAAEKTNMLRGNATAELRAELAKAGVVPEGVDLLATFAAPRIGFHDDGAVKVLSDDGKTPMVGSGANGGATLTDLAKKLAESIPHLVRDAGKGGGGKQPGSDGGTPDAKTVTRSKFDAMSHKERAEFSKSGGKVIDD